MTELALTFDTASQEANIAIALSATISLLAVIYVVVRMALVMFGRQESKEAAFMNTHLGLYASSLLVANGISSIAGLFAFRWVARHGIESGSGCSSQAFFLHFGNIAGAYFVSVIGIHTFRSLVLKWRCSKVFVVVVIVGGWLFSLVVSIVPFHVTEKGNIYNVVGLFCFIDRQYPTLRFGLHDLLILISYAVVTVSYALVFLCIRGTLVIGDRFSFNLDPQRSEAIRSALQESEGYTMFLYSIVRSMLWYPIAFILLTLPLSVMNSLDVSGIPVSPRLIAYALALSLLVGLANVAILSHTLRVLQPAFDGASRKDDDEESFYSPEKLDHVLSFKHQTLSSSMRKPLPPLQIQPLSPIFDEKTRPVPASLPNRIKPLKRLFRDRDSRPRIEVGRPLPSPTHDGFFDINLISPRRAEANNTQSPNATRPPTSYSISSPRRIPDRCTPSRSQFEPQPKRGSSVSSFVKLHLELADALSPLTHSPLSGENALDLRIWDGPASFQIPPQRSETRQTGFPSPQESRLARSEARQTGLPPLPLRESQMAEIVPVQKGWSRLTRKMTKHFVKPYSYF